MAGPKYTRLTVRTYPDPAGSDGYGIEVTAWTDDAWNRALEARRRYLADLEWQRAHPFLAGARNFLDRAGLFVNDEISLNENNIRVRNAQQHPEGLKWFREGGNEAVALLGLGTAPIWAPEVAAALPTLSGTGESGSLLSTLVPQVTSRTAPQLANMLNWGAAGTVALLLGKALSDNPPTFSTPSFSTPFSYGRVMATDAAPTDSVGVAPANPTAPTDSVGRKLSLRERVTGRTKPSNTGGRAPEDPNKKKGVKKAVENIGKFWGKVGNAAGNTIAYTVGVGAPLAILGGAGYGAYKYFNPPTELDSALEAADVETLRLLKMENLANKKISNDSIRKRLERRLNTTATVPEDATINQGDTLDAVINKNVNTTGGNVDTRFKNWNG